MTQPDYIQKIIEANDIVDYLSSHGYEYKSTNGEKYKYICPFHDDHAPSFYVYKDEHPRYYCFGCKAHGDIIDLISAMEHLSMKAVIRRLCSNAGITSGDMMNSYIAAMENSRGSYHNPKVEDISFKLSITLYQYLKQVEFDRNEIIFVEKTYKLIDDLVHAMDIKELERVYDYIVDHGLKRRYQVWAGIESVKRTSITGSD